MYYKETNPKILISKRQGTYSYSKIDPASFAVILKMIASIIFEKKVKIHYAIINTGGFFKYLTYYNDVYVYQTLAVKLSNKRKTIDKFYFDDIIDLITENIFSNKKYQHIIETETNSWKIIYSSKEIHILGDYDIFIMHEGDGVYNIHIDSVVNDHYICETMDDIYQFMLDYTNDKIIFYNVL